MHEGETDQLIREDGTASELIPKRVQSKVVIPADSPNIENLDINKILKALDEVGRGFGIAKGKMIYEAIEAASKNAGTEVGPNSDPVEQIFEMIEKRWIDFDKNNQPKFGELVLGDLETAKRFRAAMERIESTPELKERMELLIEQKRREFLDREAARRLVD
jgi:hypothetical protein